MKRIAALLLAGFCATAPAATVTPTIANVAYGTDPLQKLDVYRPRTVHNTPMPIVLMVHGGAWKGGDKAMPDVVQNKAAWLLGNGIVFVSANYRLHPAVRVDAEALDVATALQYVQQHARKWGGDPRRVILMGHSAGGNLVAVVATSADIARKVKLLPWLGTVVLDSAGYDIVALMARRHDSDIFDPIFDHDIPLQTAMSPTLLLHGPTAPVLGVCSTKVRGHCEDASGFVDKDPTATIQPEDLAHDEVNDRLGLSGAYTDAVAAWLCDKAHVRQLCKPSIGPAPRLNVGPTVVIASHGPAAVAKATASANPIMFVTAMPVGGFASNTATFAMQKTDMQSGGRGGDLWIRYPDGTLRNLTAEAGYGSTGANGFQDHNAIAVRNPDVYWDGTKAIFSMVIGAPDRQYQQGTWYWQLYEVTGLQQGGHAVITKVAGQPADFNNIMPTYGTGGSIIFVSDMPHGGPSHRYAYPQLDEYESTPTPTGLWKLQGGVVTQLTDAPSGDFHPRVDWYGRIVFTEWDHVQRDQQCDTAAAASAHGCFDYASEADGAPTTTSLTEVFPELRIGADQSHINNHTFNLFQPWAVNQDGTTLEMVDHVGRHELQGYFNRSFTDDPNIRDYTAPNTPTRLENCHQLQPEATDIGKYLCVDAPEFETQASGSIVELALPLGAHADQQPPPRFITAKANNHQYNPPSVPPSDYTGHYRDPIKLLDGTIVAAWTYQSDSYKLGDRANPTPNYDFRLISLTGTPPNMSKGAFLTPGISKSISYFDPDVRVTYNGPLWELQPVEVVARPEPPTTTTALEPPELAAFSEAGVDPAALKAWMVSKNLALFVSRNVTSRDDADRQQPFNLRVPGGTQSIGASGKIYDISTMQFFEGDAVRGYNGRAGRRKLARFMTDPAASAANTPLTPAGAPPGSVTIYPDGSVAAFVPAQKAITWATVAPDLSDVVRERYWLTGQPGEIRACDSCHGTNTLNQAGQPPPQNTPQALVALAQYWKAQNGGGPPTNQPPVAGFTWNIVGMTVTFTDTSTDPDGTILSRQWAFGDGATSTGQNPVHTYTAAGTYNVTLTVADNAGATGSVGHPVTVSVAACTNPHPVETPVCPDGQHQTGGTWTQNSPPDCSWAYVGGTCPPPPPGITATVRFGGRVCAGQFDAGTLNLSVVTNPAWTPGPSPIAIPKYILTAMDGTRACTVKGNGPAQVTYSSK